METTALSTNPPSYESTPHDCVNIEIADTDLLIPPSEHSDIQVDTNLSLYKNARISHSPPPPYESVDLRMENAEVPPSLPPLPRYKSVELSDEAVAQALHGRDNCDDSAAAGHVHNDTTGCTSGTHLDLRDNPGHANTAIQLVSRRSQSSGRRDSHHNVITGNISFTSYTFIHTISQYRTSWAAFMHQHQRIQDIKALHSSNYAIEL